MKREELKKTVSKLEIEPLPPGVEGQVIKPDGKIDPAIHYVAVPKLGGG